MGCAPCVGPPPRRAQPEVPTCADPCPLGNTYQTLSNSSSNLNTLTIFLSISRLSNLTLSIFDRVLELNLFCNRHTIIGNSTWHVLALEDNIRASPTAFLYLARIAKNRNYSNPGEKRCSSSICISGPLTKKFRKLSIFAPPLGIFAKSLATS